MKDMRVGEIDQRKWKRPSGCPPVAVDVVLCYDVECTYYATTAR
jgi:hypothetical protein